MCNNTEVVIARRAGKLAGGSSTAGKADSALECTHEHHKISIFSWEACPQTPWWATDHLGINIL